MTWLRFWTTVSVALVGVAHATQDQYVGACAAVALAFMANALLDHPTDKKRE